MDYNHIKNFLDKFKNILFEKEEKLKIISSLVKKHTQVDLNERDIKINGTTIQLKTTPIARNEILMKKELILKDLSLVDGSIYKDIR